MAIIFVVDELLKVINFWKKITFKCLHEKILINLMYSIKDNTEPSKIFEHVEIFKRFQTMNLSLHILYPRTVSNNRAGDSQQ